MDYDSESSGEEYGIIKCKYCKKEMYCMKGLELHQRFYCIKTKNKKQKIKNKKDLKLKI